MTGFPDIRAEDRFLSSDGAMLPAEFHVGASTLTIEAAGGARKTFKMLAYSGGALALKEYKYPVVVDLAGVTVPPPPIPILAEHAREVGRADSITIGATGIQMTGYVDGETDDGKLIIAASKGGFPWEASIGASVQQMDELKAGETVTVNGQTFTGPLFVARKTTLKETSFVKRGADTRRTSVAIAATHKGDIMDPKFEAFIKASGFDPATITEPQKTFLKASFDAAEKAKEPVGVTTASTTTIAACASTQPGAELDKLVDKITANIRAENVAHQKRVAVINAKCAAFPDIAAKAVAGDWTDDKIDLEILRASRPDAPVIHCGAGQADIASACMEAALCISGGISEARVGKWFPENVMNEASSARFRGARISTLMFETIRAAGMHARLGAVNDSTIRTALSAERKIRNMPPIQATGFTTMSMSGILSNVARKALIASYEAAGVVWPYFTAIRDHSDFKVYTRYRLDASGALRKVGPDGELKHVTLNEASFTNQLDTYGAIIALTRQIMINDDLGAFLQLPQMFGRMARLAPEEAFFTLLLANTGSFFSAGNNNLITGAGGVLTAANVLAAITLAETAFRNQVDSSGKPILTPPSRILTGTSNYTIALNAYEGRLKITGANQTEISNNEHAGKYTPYSSPYVNNTAVRDENGVAFSNQSSTVWWLFADPAVRAAVAMAFLNGNQIPTIENEDMQFDVLGMQWRCYLDFGVGFEDPTAAVQVNGA